MLLNKPRSPTMLSKPGTVVAVKKASSFRELSICSSSGKEKYLILLLSGSTEHFLTHEWRSRLVSGGCL